MTRAAACADLTAFSSFLRHLATFAPRWRIQGRRTPTRPAATGSAPYAVTSVTTTGATMGTASFTCDGEANTTGRSPPGQRAQTLAWDAEGSLASVTEAGTVTAEYVYHGVGHRLTRTQDGKTTLYLPGGQEVTASRSTVTAVRSVSSFRRQPSALTSLALQNPGDGLHDACSGNDGLRRPNEAAKCFRRSADAVSSEQRAQPVGSFASRASASKRAVIVGLPLVSLRIVTSSSPRSATSR